MIKKKYSKIFKNFYVNFLLFKIIGIAKFFYSFLRYYNLKTQKERNNFNKFLEEFSNENVFKPINVRGSVLVDGMWDNACHWARYCLIRKALGLHNLNEIGLLGKWNKKKVRSTFKALNIKEFYNFNPDNIKKDIYNKAVEVTMNFKKPEDIINYKWPQNVPGILIYDHLLLAQRKPIVDINDFNNIDFPTPLLPIIATESPF